MRGYARRIGSWKARTNEQSNQRQNPGFEKILIPGFLKGGESGAHTIPFPHLRDSSLNNGPRKMVCVRGGAAAGIRTRVVGSLRAILGRPMS